MCFVWKVWVRLRLSVLTGHAVYWIDLTRSLFLVLPLTNIFQKCLSLTKILAVNVGQRRWFCQNCRITMLCTLSPPLMFFMDSLGVSLLARSLPSIVSCSTISSRVFSLPALTNSFWKMSVNDQHFCSKCWSMGFMSPEMKDNHMLHLF